MKAASVATQNLLKTGDAIMVLPEVLVDWNLNRYNDTKTDNIPDEYYTEYSAELFPLESIAEPNRPYKGINKVRINQATVSKNYKQRGIEGSNARFYIADEEDHYKYWTSPAPADGNTMLLFNTTNFPDAAYPGLTGHDGLTCVRPSVEYGDYDEEEVFTPKFVDANKIVIKVENTWASPDDFDIVITRDGTTATVTNEQITAGWEGPGEIVLRWNGTSWASDNTLTANAQGFPVTDKVKKVQMVVRTLKGGYQKTDVGATLEKTKYYVPETQTWHDTTGADAYFDLIEISARLEADLTPWVQTMDDTADMGETSQLYPIGTLTTNVANISLSNIYEDSAGEKKRGLFSADNDDPEVPWRNYIEPNADVIQNYIFHAANGTFLERIRQFTGLSEDWTGQAGETVNLSAADYAKILNEGTVPAVMWEELPVSEIIWRLCDAVGFNKFYIPVDSSVAVDHKIPVFYTTGEETPWEVLDELAKATQTAIYFDHYGIMQVRTRAFAYSPDNVAVWDVTSEPINSTSPNIIELDQENGYEPNHIKVTYQKTNWSDWNNGNPEMQVVWEPEEETVVLRGTPLVKTMGINADYFWVGEDDVVLWPFEGYVNIEGEIIKYKGKEFIYYTGEDGEILNKVDIFSSDEMETIQRDLVATNDTHRSHYTGALKVDKDEPNSDEGRGAWNTTPVAHSVDIEGWDVRSIVNGTRNTNASGMKHLKQESRVLLRPGSRHKDYGDLLVATKGNQTDTGFYQFGTKLQFVKDEGRTGQVAGLVINNNDGGEEGYYIELTLSSKMTGEIRKRRNELIVYSRKNGENIRLGGTGTALAITEGMDYEIDVTLGETESNAHVLRVFVDGKAAFEDFITGGDKNPIGGKFGIFARGKTKASFEYMYAVRYAGDEPSDDFGFLDRVKRAYAGGGWDREWVYDWHDFNPRRRKILNRDRYRYNRRFFDDFGPYVHEIRGYEVKFDPQPVLHSKLFLTNDWSAACLEYRGRTTGAYFVLANTQRANAVIHGEDTLSFPGTDNSVNQLLNVFGRVLTIEDAEEVIAENTDQIRARGKIEAELSSAWTQSKAMAEDIAAWIRDNFSYGNDSQNVEMFGNPLIQVGDVVALNHPEKNITGEFFVVGVTNNFDSGIVTTLLLRRRVNSV